MEYRKDVSRLQQPQVCCVAHRADGMRLMRVYFDTTSATVKTDDETSHTEYTSHYIQLWSSDTDATTLAREYATAQAQQYGDSNTVNRFTVNGQASWLDRDTRVGISNAIATILRKGEKQYSLILQQTYTMDASIAQAMMDSIETYAYGCHIQTQKHVDAIATLQSVDSILQYDYTANYPECPAFTV